MSPDQHPGSASSGPSEGRAPIPGHEPVALAEAPPERVGLLLAEARTRQGLGLAEVVDSIDAELEPAELMALESGALEVPPEVLAELSLHYGVDPETLVPPRSALVIDLNEGYLRAGPDMALLTDGAGRQAVFNRYLEMVWELRSVEPGSVVPLRGADMSALAVQFGTEPEVVESELRRMMLRRTTRRRNGVLVGLAAAVLAVTGGVIAWQVSSEATTTEPTAVQQSPPPAPTAEIGDAATLERESPGGSSEDLGALPPAPSAEIGDAATLERDDTGIVPGAPRTDLESLSPAPEASVGDAAVQERNPDGTPGEQQTR